MKEGIVTILSKGLSAKQQRVLEALPAKTASSRSEAGPGHHRSIVRGHPEEGWSRGRRDHQRAQETDAEGIGRIRRTRRFSGGLR